METQLILSKILPFDMVEHILDMLTPRNMESKPPEEIFAEYCEIGYYDAIKKMLSKNIGIGMGLLVSCNIGYSNITRIIINKINKKMSIGLRNADKNGYAEIVKSITNYSNDYKIRGFYIACHKGHKSTIDIIINSGLSDNIIQEGLRIYGEKFGDLKKSD